MNNNLKWKIRIWFRTPIHKRISKFLRNLSIRKGDDVAYVSTKIIGGKKYTVFYQGVWDGEKVMFKNQNNEIEITVRGKQHLIKLKKGDSY